MFTYLDPDEAAALRKVALRLYTENRLNGNEMRDLAQTIDGVLDRALKLDDPCDVECPRCGPHYVRSRGLVAPCSVCGDASRVDHETAAEYVNGTRTALIVARVQAERLRDAWVDEDPARERDDWPLPWANPGELPSTQNRK